MPGLMPVVPICIDKLYLSSYDLAPHGLVFLSIDLASCGVTLAGWTLLGEPSR